MAEKERTAARYTDEPSTNSGLVNNMRGTDIAQTPNFRRGQSADRDILGFQRRTAGNFMNMLGRALMGERAGTMPGVSQILSRKGKISGEHQKMLSKGLNLDAREAKEQQGRRQAAGDFKIGRGEVDAAATQMWKSRRSESARMTQDEERKRHRDDLAQIFGRSQAQASAVPALNMGTIPERAMPRSRGDKFFDGVNRVLGGLFCWVAREVLGDDNDDWKLAREGLLMNASREEAMLYLNYGEALAQRLTPEESLALKPLFLDLMEEGRNA